MRSVGLLWRWCVCAALASTALLGQIAGAMTFTLDNCQRNEIVFVGGGEQDEQDDPPEVGAESIKADPKPDVKPPPPASGQPLTVRTGPPDARVRIMNIGPRYQPGIRLPPDSYVIEVTADGFDTVQRTLRHGDEPTDAWVGLPFRDCPVCPTMVEIPTGSYTMGTSRGKERSRNEGPAHEVKIQCPIAVGKFEVSFDEWDACRNDGGCQRHLEDEGKGRSGYPVAQATLSDAKEYTKWLTVRTGRSYRLLSEAEWEYAARAGTSSERHWDSGEETQCAYENGADTTAGGEYSDWETASCTDGHVYAAPSTDIGFRPNPWALYHMLGNVSEWTEDCWHQTYKGAPDDGSPWKDNCDSGHVVRGGSWLVKPGIIRAPVRLSYDPARSHSDVGFRVAVEIKRCRATSLHCWSRRSDESIARCLPTTE